MREMKDSGIAWIGEIPKEWKVIPMKSYFYMKGRIGWQGLKANEFMDEGPFLVTGTDFLNGKVNWDTCYHISEERFNEAPEIHVENNDILITKDGTIGKLAYIENKPQKVSLNSHLLIIRPLVSFIHNYFIYWALQSPNFEHYSGLVQSGTTMASLSQEKIGNYKLALPSLPEQLRIATFLDEKCKEIDVLMALQEEMITELQAYKQSVITETVTKGLNLNVSMKDSGVEWIGEIPEHWEVSQIKRIFDNLDFLREPISAEMRSRKNPLYDYYGASGIIDKIDFYNVNDKVLLIGEDGANLVLRNLPLIYKAEGKFWVNNHAHILKPLKDDYDFLAYVMEAADYTNYITGSAQPKLSQSKLNMVKLPIPPLSEQQAIADYLDTQCSRIDKLVALKRTKIEELQDYKKSVIYEYVTGKKEVPATV